MSDGAPRSYKAWVHDKRSLIEDHLKEFPPTIVIRRPEGIYVFADSIAKVHTTIVLAGAGRAFPSVSDWFRRQLSDLALTWSPREPNAEVEARLLQQVFYQNLDASLGIVFADIVIAEVGAVLSGDYVARADFSGKIVSFSKETTAVVSYRSVKENGDRNGEVGSSTSQEELARLRQSAEEEYKRALSEEFAKSNINLPADLENPSQLEVFLRDLKERYSRAKCFLRRDHVREKKYHWVFERL